MDTKIVTIVVVALICIVLVWLYVKSGQKQGYKVVDIAGQRYLTYDDETAVNTRPNPLPPAVPATPTTPATTTARRRKEGFEANAEGETEQGYTPSSGNEQTIFDPDFYLDLGKDGMKNAKNRMKSFEEIKYTTPQQLMAPDAATELDNIVQSETVQHVVSSGLIGRTNTSRAQRESSDMLRGDLPIAPVMNTSVVQLADPNSVNSGYYNTDYGFNSGSGS
jgi:Family of unknown function (DUF5850)